MTDLGDAQRDWIKKALKEKAALYSNIAERNRGLQDAQNHRIQSWSQDYEGIQRAYSDERRSGPTVVPCGDGTVRVVHSVIDIQQDQQPSDHVLSFYITCWSTPPQGEKVPAGEAADQPRVNWRWECWGRVREETKTVIRLLGGYYTADAAGCVSNPHISGTGEGPCPACGLGTGDLGVDPVLEVRRGVDRQWNLNPTNGSRDCPGCPDTDES